MALLPKEYVNGLLNTRYIFRDNLRAALSNADEVKQLYLKVCEEKEQLENNLVDPSNRKDIEKRSYTEMENRIAKLQEDYQLQTSNMEKLTEERKQKMEKDYGDKLRKIEIQYDLKLKTAKDGYEKEIDKLKQSLSKTINSTNYLTDQEMFVSKLMSELNKREGEADTRITNMKEQYENLLRDEQDKCENKIKQIEKEYSDKLLQFTGALQATDTIESESSKENSGYIKVMEENYSKMLKKKDEDHEKYIKAFVKSCDKKCNQFLATKISAGKT